MSHILKKKMLILKKLSKLNLKISPQRKKKKKKGKKRKKGKKKEKKKLYKRSSIITEREREKRK